MNDEKLLSEVGQRMEGLREACGVSQEEMAQDLGVSLETYRQWEKTGDDVPISALYHMAQKFDVELTELLTGTAAKLDTYHVVRKGEGREVDRYPGYYYEDMAWRFRDKIMQPLVVFLDPSDEPAALVTHQGQEFNFVIEGTVIVTIGDKEFTLNPWDSIYFNPMIPHGQRCGGTETAKFITIIAE